MLKNHLRPPARAPAHHPDQFDLFEYSFDDVADFSDDDIQDIRYWLLTDAIRRLHDPRLGREYRSDILGWIENDGNTPFSFRVCCLTEGIDPDELRDLFHSRFTRRLGRAA